MRMRKFLAAALAAVMLIGMLPAATAAVTNPPANTEGGVTLGKQVQLLWQEDRREVVEALDVDDQFGLVVRHADGRTEVIRSGEVSVRGMYGYIE